MNDEAIKMFNNCINHRRSGELQGIPTRAYLAISREYGGLGRDSLKEITREKIRELVETGEIRRIRGIGTKTLYALCEWLVNTPAINSEANSEKG